ncbi:DUF1648 domain-containing protein [Paenibacillus sp. sgz500958]|uniref:DUF1648 domain-containing protein n=1 Tax=Paenibacillus sp. sgz500958 TaxID=3242475 RepID=UPI0036D27746
MAKKRMLLILNLMIAIVPFLVYYLLFPHMPDEVPIHYNGSGVADRFVPRTSWELLFLSALGFLGLIMMKLLYAVLHKRQLPPNAKDIPAAISIWATATIFVTTLFAGIGISAFFMMV